MEVAASGSLGYAPQEVAEMVMRIFSEQSGVRLAKAASSRELVPGTWIRVAEDDPSADPSRIRLYLKTAEEGARVQDRLHGKAIQVGVDLVTLRTETVAAASRRNNRRGARQGPPK